MLDIEVELRRRIHTLSLSIFVLPATAIINVQ